MSQEKMGILGREYTRRQFMSLSAKGLSGVVLSSSLLSLMGVTQAQADSGQVEVLATPDYLLVANHAKCTACERCELNCTLANGGAPQPYLGRLRVRDNVSYGSNGPIDDYNNGDGIFGQWSMMPDTCKQCKDAPCLRGCPVNAIYVSSSNGARMIDANTCIGCGLCVRNCPWSMPRIDPAKNISTKCVNCGACAAGCPTSALKMIPWEDVTAAV